MNKSTIEEIKRLYPIGTICINDDNELGEFEILDHNTICMIGSSIAIRSTSVKSKEKAKAMDRALWRTQQGFARIILKPNFTEVTNKELLLIL